MALAEEIDVGEVEHVRRAGIEFVESILGRKGRIEELSNNSLGYQTFDGVSVPCTSEMLYQKG
jgi:hypothetical protein